MIPLVPEKKLGRPFQLNHEEIIREIKELKATNPTVSNNRIFESIALHYGCSKSGIIKIYYDWLKKEKDSV